MKNLFNISHFFIFWNILYKNITFKGKDEICMFQKNCNFLSTITVSVIIAFIITILFYNGIFTEIFYLNIFSLVLAILSILVLTLFGLSDNGLTRAVLCNHCVITSVSILGNIFFNLIALLIHITTISILTTVITAIASFFFIFNLLCIFLLLISILKYDKQY
jgi:hypothetical protein